MEIKRNGIEDIFAGLPGLEPLGFAFEPDLYLCTLGFEDRTSSALEEYLKCGNLGGATVGLIVYPTNVQENEGNLWRFGKAAEQMLGLKKIGYSGSANTVDFKNEIRKLLVGKKKVIFDISTCSSYIFYPVMSELMKADVELKIVYAEALEYEPSEDEWKKVKEKEDVEGERNLFKHGFEEAEFQSSGVDDIHNCGRGTEMNPGNYPSVLVMVPNFASLRVNAMIRRDSDANRTADRNIKWIIGDPPAEENKWRVQALISTAHLDDNGMDVHKASTFNYREIVEVLETIWQECRYERYMTIGSLGSKMQHLGIYIFLSLHPDVGLWVSEPREFKASKYSKGTGPLHQICFGPTSKARNLISSYMKFVCL